MTLTHRLAHALGWNGGRVETFTVNDENARRFFVGFRCSGCGELSGVEEYDPDSLDPRLSGPPRGRRTTTSEKCWRCKGTGDFMGDPCTCLTPPPRGRSRGSSR